MSELSSRDGDSQESRRRAPSQRRKIKAPVYDHLARATALRAASSSSLQRESLSAHGHLCTRDKKASSSWTLLRGALGDSSSITHAAAASECEGQQEDDKKQARPHCPKKPISPQRVRGPLSLTRENESSLIERCARARGTRSRRADDARRANRVIHRVTASQQQQSSSSSSSVGGGRSDGLLPGILARWSRKISKIDSVWGWASPPLRLQVAGGTRTGTSAGVVGGSSAGPAAAGGGGAAAATAVLQVAQQQTSYSSSSSSQRMGEMVVDRAPSPARLSHTSEKHPRATLTELTVLRRHRELCDVVLIVGSRKIFAHRVILSACSPYFRAMFTGELAESKQTEVTIQDIDEMAMELLIDFCYTSHIIVEEANVQTLLPAACLLQLAEIQDICCEFLKRQLDPSNCLGIRAFADTHSCRELLRIADKFTQHNFQEVMESEEFLLLPVGQLVDIISSDELNVRTEEQVFSAVMNWVKYNVTERRQHLAQVLQHVRLPLLSPKFLVGTVGSDLLVRSDEACRDLVDEAKNYLLLPQERPLMQGPRTRPRKPTRRGEVLFAVGGWCSGDAIASVERFDPNTVDWKMVAPMSKRRCGVGVAVLNDLLYAVGGHDGQSYLNSIERYDPQTNQWSCDVAPTTSCRTSVGVAVLEGYLYAVGGQDGVQCLNHVERYDPKENKWSKVSPMTTRRLGVAVAVLGGYLYAIGGSDGQSPLNTVERYDPRQNKWSQVSPMSTRRKHLGCAVFNNLIYAVGGRDDCMELSSAERYNPHTNSWSPIVAMTSRRSGVGLAVVNGQLYAVGGFDGTAYLKTIEVYDPEQNQWRLCGCMNYRRLGGGVGVMRAPQTENYIW